MREQPGFFVSCPAFGVVTLKSSPLPQSCPGFLEPPPEVLSGVPLLPMFCPDLLGLSSPSPTPVPPRPLDSSPTPSVPSHRPPQPRFPPRPSGTSPAAGPFREAPLGNGAAPRPGRTFRKPREACRETPVRPAAERTGPGARPASPRPPAAPRATPAVRALEVQAPTGMKLLFAFLLFMGWPHGDIDPEAWTYNLKCYDCWVTNTFYCSNIRVCPYEIRRCLTISSRPY
ncbi:translation initiation factor IF-2 isoform X2 [Camelus ferus]|uniref:Translation initiation factor IF-2 isoform X2 n=1 Tax=Camelus ferus TaxID=419612 RepID=A0A8B8S0C5_CAMFR|nr:translation initiation factor IF-2 isoform X2 [Camelus ferus]